jgi:hypothetical protein
MHSSSTKLFFLLICMFMSSLSEVSAQRFTVGALGGMSNPELFFEWLSPVNVISQKVEKWKTVHFGATARYQLFQKLYARSDIYYMGSETDFIAEYKVLDTKWVANASFQQSTIHLMFAPQLHMFPGNIGYVYGGFMFEFNTGSDFKKGTFTKTDEMTGSVSVEDFANVEAKNTVNPTAVMGLGVNPRFGKFGVMLDARFTRSRAEAVYNLVPRIGRENFVYSAGITYDISSQ